MQPNSKDNAKIVYDGECPFCSAYIRHLRLKEACGTVELIDARSDAMIVKELISKGYDLDEGMVLVLDGQVYHGDECIHALALMTSPSSLFNRINARIFSSRKLSTVLYPMLRGCRNAALRALGRTKIQEST